MGRVDDFHLIHLILKEAFCKTKLLFKEHVKHPFLMKMVINFEIKSW